MKATAKNKDGLAERATKALGWSFLNNMIARFSTIGIGVALARILGPREFGEFAVAMVALLALLSFNELGVSLAIVRWEGDPSEIVPTVSTISVVSSVIIYVGCFIGAPAFASAMGAPAAANVIRVLAINVIFDGLVSTPVALMQRYFRQDRKMIADLANNWIGTGVSIALALMHFGAMSLAFGRLSGAAVAAVLFIKYSPEPLRFGFDPAKARQLLRFGGPLAGASIVVFAVQNSDQLVVGHFLGATALGFYALAFNLSGWPLNIFSMPIRTMAPALFSRLQHDKTAMRESFLACLGLVEAATLPICLLISGAAVPLIHFVYGTRWTLAAQALVWLGGLTAMRILFEFIYDFFVVLARSTVVLTVQVVWLIVLVPCLIAGTKIYGIGGAAMAEVAVGLLVVLPWYMVELAKVGIGTKPLLARLSLPLLAAAVVGLAANLIARAIPQAFAACVISGVLALAIIALLVYRLRSVVTALRATLHNATTAEPEEAKTAQPQRRISKQPWDTAQFPVVVPAEQSTEPRPPARPQPRPYRPVETDTAAGSYPAVPGQRPGPQRPAGPLPPAASHGNGSTGAPYPAPTGPEWRGPRPPFRAMVPESQGLTESAAPAGQGQRPAGQPSDPVRSRGRGSRLRQEGRRIAAALSETAPLPRIGDLTGPLEVYRDPLALMPIYQQTVQAMKWNPVSTSRGQRRRRNNPRMPRQPGA